MNDSIKRKKIGEGVFFTAITDPKFKSNRISVNLLLPLEEETAANRAIVPCASPAVSRLSGFYPAE